MLANAKPKSLCSLSASGSVPNRGRGAGGGPVRGGYPVDLRTNLPPVKGVRKYFIYARFG